MLGRARALGCQCGWPARPIAAMHRRIAMAVSGHGMARVSAEEARVRPEWGSWGASCPCGLAV